MLEKWRENELSALESLRFKGDLGKLEKTQTKTKSDKNEKNERHAAWESFLAGEAVGTPMEISLRNLEPGGGTETGHQKPKTT